MLFFLKARMIYSAIQRHSEKATYSLWLSEQSPRFQPRNAWQTQSTHWPTRSPEMDEDLLCTNSAHRELGPRRRVLQRGTWHRLWEHVVLKKDQLHVLEETCSRFPWKGCRSLARKSRRGGETGGRDVTEQTGRAHGTKVKGRGRPREL